MPQETREEALARMESQGMLDPKCPGCQEAYQVLDRMPFNVFMPSHKASKYCKSGKRPHCTCDACF
jgi:phage FluMu protein Com